MKLNVNNNFSVLFMIFISTLPLFPVKTHARNRTYRTYEDDDRISHGSYFMFPNGDTLLRFYRPLNDSCNEPNLRLRLLHWDGTISALNVQNFSIPEFNYCYAKNSLDDYIKITNLSRSSAGIFYIMYYNISNVDKDAPFGRIVLEVNYTTGEMLG